MVARLPGELAAQFYGGGRQSYRWAILILKRTQKRRMGYRLAGSL